MDDPIGWGLLLMLVAALVTVSIAVVHWMARSKKDPRGLHSVRPLSDLRDEDDPPKR
jgi:hypothetical protein